MCKSLKAVGKSRLRYNAWPILPTLQRAPSMMCPEIPGGVLGALTGEPASSVRRSAMPLRMMMRPKVGQRVLVKELPDEALQDARHDRQAVGPHVSDCGRP